MPFIALKYANALSIKAHFEQHAYRNYISNNPHG